MTKTEQAVNIMARILLDQYSGLNPADMDPNLVSDLRLLRELTIDGRITAWSDERRDSHGDTIRAAHEKKRSQQTFYLQRTIGEVVEITGGWQAAANAVGIQVNSLRCMISNGRGVTSFKRDTGLWILGKTIDLVEEFKTAKFNESGNPDDIISEKKSFRVPQFSKNKK